MAGINKLHDTTIKKQKQVIENIRSETVETYSLEFALMERKIGYLSIHILTPKNV